MRKMGLSRDAVVMYMLPVDTSSRCACTVTVFSTMLGSFQS